jgi:hypothetical protein
LRLKWPTVFCLFLFPPSFVPKFSYLYACLGNCCSSCCLARCSSHSHEQLGSSSG